MSPLHDLVILGSGTTAFAGALRAAEAGARVLMVEHSLLGGTCVNWGCIPSKTLIDKARGYYEARRGPRFGMNLTAGPPDCERLMAAKTEAVETVRYDRYQKVLEAHPGIEVRRGHGRFLSPRELQVGADVVVSERFLIACGGVPRLLHLPGAFDIDYLTSYSALHLPCIPRSLVIIGGGVIALEMGQMFCRFGAAVTIVERGERPLKDFDRRLTDSFEAMAAEEGMEMVFGVEVQKFYRDGSESCLQALVGGVAREFRAERIMFAVGTAPATEDVGLEAAGVEVDLAGFIRVDEEMRTTAAGIWAAGDVTGPPLIAPAGAREAEVAVDNLLNPEAHRRIDHRFTPMAVFTDPEFATVGIDAQQAISQGKEVIETFFDLHNVAKAHVLGECRGGILLCAEKGTGRVLGVQMLASRGADVIHEAALAVRFGLTVEDLATTVHVYPTISDGLRLAALENLSQQGRRQP